MNRDFAVRKDCSAPLGDRFSKAALIAALAFGTAPAHAQDQAPVSGEQASTSGTSADIVVTANKFGSELSKAPVVVTSFSPERLEQTRVLSVQDVAFQTPGVIINNPGNYSSTYIRGIGATFSTAGLESPVATYVDGVYLQHQNGSSVDLVDVQSVDVLKGPQGTLYGRNATGGAVLIQTANPVDYFEGFVSGEYANFDQKRIQAVVNLPLTDTLALRISGQYRDNDGYIRNVQTNEMGGEGSTKYIRAKLKWDVTPEFVVQYSFEYAKLESTAYQMKSLLDAPYCTACFAIPGTIVPKASDGFYTASASNNYNNVEYFSNTLILLYTTDDFAINSVTGYRHQHTTGENDLDNVSPRFFWGKLGEKGPTLTNDTFIRTTLDTPLNGLFGFSFLRDRDHQTFPFGGIAIGPGLVGLNDNRVKIDSYSVYGELNYAFGAGFKITAGARYNYDKKRISIFNDPLAIAVFGLPAGSTSFKRKVSFNSVTPRFVLSYENGGNYYYASYNRGEKSGAFPSPVSDPSSVPASPEKLDSFEIGAKNSFFGGRLRTALSAFHGRYKDIQVIIEDAARGAQLLQNAASAKLWGVELTADAQVSDSLTLSGGVTYLHNKYGSFPNAAVYAPSAVGTVCSLTPAVGLTGCSEDLSGTRMPHSPTWSGYVSATYTTKFADDWTLRVGSNAHFTTRYDFTAGGGGPLGLDVQKGYTRVDANLTVIMPNEKTEFGLFATNIFKTHYYDYAVAGGFGAYAVPSMPRTYGVRLKQSF